MIEYIVNNSGGEQSKTPSAKYIGLPAMEVKASGTEGSEVGQITAIGKRAFVVRKLNRSITVQMAVREGGVLYQVTSVHPYGSDRASIVIECESRDS